MSDTKTEYRSSDLTTTDSKTGYGSTRTQPPAPQPDPEPEPKTKLLDLSPTQLTGGALAAMTSAVVGARLGVAGTVLGAAVGSVVAGVAGTLYTTSLRRTKEKLSSVIVTKADPERDAEPGIPAELPMPVTAILPAAPDQGPATTSGASGNSTGGQRVGRDHPRSSARATNRWPWKAILVSTAAVFVLAFAAITGFEVLTGHAISGGQGTTITQVSEGRSGGTSKPKTVPADSTSAEPSTAPSEASSEPTEEPSQTAEPDQSASAPATSSEPTTAPSESQSSDSQQVSGQAASQSPATDSSTADTPVGR